MEDVSKNLDKFIKEGLPQALEKGLRQACIVVQDAAKAKCPVDDGQLRQSISYKVNAEKGEGIVGTDVEYAPYVEYGTGIYATKGGGRTTEWVYQDAKGDYHTTRGMRAQPFLIPAAEENLKEIENCFEGLI